MAWQATFLAGLSWLAISSVQAYPIDAGPVTGIYRLYAYEESLDHRIRGVKTPLPGARLIRKEVVPRLLREGHDMPLPAVDEEFKRQVYGLLEPPRGRYAFAVLDITDIQNPVYAEYRPEARFNPGSVGKLAVAMSIFSSLAEQFPEDVAAREGMLSDAYVVAPDLVKAGTHKVPFWNPETGKMTFRLIRPGDEANLWTWLDWMMSASSNTAASTVIREAMLMRHFKPGYPVDEESKDEFFRTSTHKQRSELLRETLDAGVLEAGLDPEQFRQGGFFTGRAKRIASGTSSRANVRELMKFLLRLEQGKVIDEFSSREIKRLMYMTQKRIRYASSPALNAAAVYFKSGSLYRCHVPEAGCPKYMGDKDNLLNSVAIIESPAGARDGLHYMAVVTSNVLNVNSAVTHQTLATRIHRLIQSRHTDRAPAR